MKTPSSALPPSGDLANPARPAVLFQDNHLLVLAKPAGMLAQGDDSQRPNLLDWAKQYRIQTENKPGNVFVGLVHRLDGPVTGVMIFARTSKAARRLSEAFRNRQVQKIYWAVVSLEENTNLPLDALATDPTPQRWHHRITPTPQKHQFTAQPIRPLRSSSSASTTVAKDEGQTDWLLKAQHQRLAVLQLHPITGRRHQLRAQCQAERMPIVGDRTYGSRHAFPAGIALHARQLTVPHPIGGESVTFTCPLPASWRSLPGPLGQQLGPDAFAP